MNDYYAGNDEQAIVQVEEEQTEESQQEENFVIHDQANAPDPLESGQFSWLRDEEISELQSRWDSIQTGFVDEPRAAVEKAETLLSDAWELIDQVYANKRAALKEEWGSREDISTEDLRLALRNYRSFLNRLLEL